MLHAYLVRLADRQLFAGEHLAFDVIIFATGFIAVSRVELIGAAPPTGRTEPRTGQAAQPPPARAPLPANRSLFRFAAQGGYGRFTAEKAFEAVTGSSGGPWFGGGLRYDAAQHYFAHNRQHTSGLEMR